MKKLTWNLRNGDYELQSVEIHPHPAPSGMIRGVALVTEMANEERLRQGKLKLTLDIIRGNMSDSEIRTNVEIMTMCALADIKKK